MGKKCFIYALTQDNIVIYVGRSVNPQNRVKDHKYLYNYFSVKDWFILEETDILNSYWLEKYWINQFIAWGFPLKNTQFTPKEKVYNSNRKKELESATSFLENYRIKHGIEYWDRDLKR